DDAYTFGRIAATNALSDIYAMGGEPLVALNLLGWPRDKLPTELAAEVLRGGLDVGRAAHCHVAGGHSIRQPEPQSAIAAAPRPGCCGAAPGAPPCRSACPSRSAPACSTPGTRPRVRSARPRST